MDISTKQKYIVKATSGLKVSYRAKIQNISQANPVRCLSSLLIEILLKILSKTSNERKLLRLRKLKKL